MKAAPLNGATFDNIKIDGNWIQETTDEKRPLQIRESTTSTGSTPTFS